MKNRKLFSFRGSFFSVPREQIVHLYSTCRSSIFSWFFYETTYTFYFRDYLFGHRIRKVFSPGNLCRCSISDFAFSACARKKKRYVAQRNSRAEVWKFYSRCLYCANTSGTLFCSSICESTPYTCVALFFTRKTPLRCNSARWITSPPSRPHSPPHPWRLFKKRQRRQLGVRAVRDTGSKRITLRMQGQTKLSRITSVLTFSRINDKATCPGLNSSFCTFKL